MSWPRMKARPPGFHQIAFASLATAVKARPMPSARAPGAKSVEMPPASDWAWADAAKPARRTSAKAALEATVRMRLMWKTSLRNAGRDAERAPDETLSLEHDGTW